MKRARFIPKVIAIAGPALLLTACDIPPAKPEPGRVTEFRAPLPEPRRASNPPTGALLWMQAWDSVRSRRAELQAELAGLQVMYAENDFDVILQRDPAELNAEQLSSLYHLLNRGFFHVEREVMLHLLEVRRNREPLSAPDGTATRLTGRIQTAMHSDELRVMDLESVTEIYRKPGDAALTIPGSLTEEEMEELRAAVTGMMDKQRALNAELDAKIRDLQNG